MSRIMMPGEIEDGRLYTDKALAARHDRTRDWVLEQYVFPNDGQGNPIPGVPCMKRGNMYLFSGLQIRLWHEAHAGPQEREPKLKGKSQTKKAGP